ncbi:MAG: DUF1573 domain-containing protein [Acidobacteriota bacterium]
MNSRRQFKGSVAVLVLLISASAAAQQADGARTTQPAARAYVPIDSYDFGDIYKGELISQIFVIRNEGDAELRIEGLSTGCGCSVIDSDKAIPPGKEGKAQLQVNTSSQNGQISKIATLRTNDPERPNIVLTLSANILTSGDGGPVKGVVLRPGKHIGPIFLGPDATAAFTATEGKAARTEFTVTVERGNLKVLRLETQHFVSRIETVEEGKIFKLIFESRLTDPPGSHSEQVRVVTNSDALPYFFVNVGATIKPKPSA